jgi:hypothetical protein
MAISIRGHARSRHNRSGKNETQDYVRHGIIFVGLILMRIPQMVAYERQAIRAAAPVPAGGCAERDSRYPYEAV